MKKLIALLLLLAGSVSAAPTKIQSQDVADSLLGASSVTVAALGASTAALQGEINAVAASTAAIQAQFVAVGAATAAISGSTFTRVNSNASQFTGDGTAANSLTLKSSSVTLLGNNPPAANIGAGTLSASVIASSVTNTGVNGGSCGSPSQGCVLSANADGRLVYLATTTISSGGGGSGINTSTASMNWGNPTSQITSGTTIYAFIPTQSLTLRKLCVTIHTADNSSTGSYFDCGAGGPATIVVRTTPAQSLGTVSCATGTINVPAGTQGSCYLNSDAGSKPITNNYLEYTTP